MLDGKWILQGMREISVPSEDGWMGGMCVIWMGREAASGVHSTWVVPMGKRNFVSQAEATDSISWLGVFPTEGPPKLTEDGDDEWWEKIVYYWAAIGPEWIIRDFIRVIGSRNNVLRIVNGITGTLGAAALGTKQFAQESYFEREDYIYGISDKTKSLHRASQALGVTVGILGTIFDTADFVISVLCFVFSSTNYYCSRRFRFLDVVGSSLYMIGHIIIWAYPPSALYVALVETYYSAIVFSFISKDLWAQGIPN